MDQDTADLFDALISGMVHAKAQIFALKHAVVTAPNFSHEQKVAFKDRYLKTYRLNMKKHIEDLRATSPKAVEEMQKLLDVEAFD